MSPASPAHLTARRQSPNMPKDSSVCGRCSRAWSEACDERRGGLTSTGSPRQTVPAKVAPSRRHKRHIRILPGQLRRCWCTTTAAAVLVYKRCCRRLSRVQQGTQGNKWPCQGQNRTKRNPNRVTPRVHTCPKPAPFPLLRSCAAPNCLWSLVVHSFALGCSKVLTTSCCGRECDGHCSTTAGVC